MTTRPVFLPTFATDPLITAGPQAGLSTRLDPGAPTRAQGFYQDRRLPARAFSSLLGNVGDWISYLADREHDAFKFTRTDLALGTSRMTRLSAVQQTIAVGLPANRPQSILMSGASAGSAAQALFLNDGTTPSVGPATLAASLALSAPASDASGISFVGVAGGTVIQYSGGGTAGVTITGQTQPILFVGHTANHYIAYESITQKVFTCTSLGGVWSSTTLGTSMSNIYNLLTNQAGDWVMVGKGVAGGQVFAFCSTDDGVTWSSGELIASGVSTAGFCYSAQDKLFYVLDSGGRLFSSPTGFGTWTLIKTVAALNGLTLGQNTFASCGPALACLANRGANSNAQYANGIAYTLDRGQSWYESYIGSTDNQPLTNLIAANGRFYAIDGLNLYQSGVMTVPPSLFAGV